MEKRIRKDPKPNDPNNPDDPDNPGGNGSGLTAWTKVTSPLPDNELTCIAFGDGKFVAAGDDGII